MGPPKKTRVPQRLQKNKRGGDYLFCVKKKKISPKLDSPENNPSMTSFLHQFQSFRVLFTNIYIFCLSCFCPFTYYLTQISYHDIPQAHFNHFQPPSPIPAHLMEPCFLSPDSVQLWSCVTLLATSLPKETYVTTGAWQGRSYPF